MNSQDAGKDALRSEISVPVSPARAFSSFVQEISEWWPSAYTWSGPVLERMVIEGKAGGACYEIGPRGFRCDWGRVRNFDEPDRLLFLWQISARRVPLPDPAQASEVEVSFSLAGTGTRVLLEHRGFSRHGADGEWYRDAMASDRGWPLILDQFAAHLGDGHLAPEGTT